jgi:ATP-binding cassette, subfamily B, bacterial
MKTYTKETFRIYFEEVKKYKFQASMITFSVIIASALDIIVPLFYKEFFNILAESTSIEASTGLLMGVLIKIALLMLSAWTFWRIAGFSESDFFTKTMANIYDRCFSYLHQHSPSFFHDNFVGSLVKKVNGFARSFQSIIDILIWDIVGIIVSIVLIVYFLSKENIYLGLMIVVWIIVYMIINILFSRYKLKYDIKRNEAQSASVGVLADTITNHDNVKLFNGYSRERKYFFSKNEKVRKLARFSWNLANLFEAIQTILMIILQISLFYIAILLWKKGQLTIGDFVLIQTYIMTIIGRVWSFGRTIRAFYESLSNAEEMTEILMTPHDIVDITDAKNLKVDRGEIKFDKVNFSYQKTRKILKDFNLTITPREKIGLIGPSGAGKSTVINLLLRNRDIESGGIYIDGQRVKDVTRESLWKSIALVNQDPILFHRSLKENIRYGRPSATDKDVIQAAKLANCHQFIEKLPEGYQTHVGERGVKLSGGERQRVAIARAILKNSPILVLDEATSSLDSESEGLIQEALDRLMKDKTVIVIAHRLSTIMKMDRIIVVDNGKIIEEDTHDELLNKKTGLYKTLWEKQVGGFVK